MRIGRGFAIYIRNGEALETAATLNTLVFDKTGTITEGKPAVTDFLLLEGQDEARILALVAGVEAHSEHFLARAISAWCRARAVSPAPTLDFEASPGHGVRARAKGRKGEEILVGNAVLLDAAGVDYGAQQDQARVWAVQGKTPVYVAIGGACVALFAIADQARAGAKEAIALLHRLGLQTVMATGDVEAVANHIARQVGIELSRRTMSIIRQNPFWALGYNFVAIPVAAAVRPNPMIAAAAMAMNSVSVVTNSLRLQR